MGNLLLTLYILLLLCILVTNISKAYYHYNYLYQCNQLRSQFDSFFSFSLLSFNIFLKASLHSPFIKKVEVKHNRLAQDYFGKAKSANSIQVGLFVVFVLLAGFELLFSN